MAIEINYKKKYIELRSKYINDIDIAFRIGFEQGQQQAQQQQALDAEQQARESEITQVNAMEQPSQENMIQEQSKDEQQQEGQDGSELDQHINKLESMLNSGAKENNEEIQKSLKAIVTLRKAEKFAIAMKKSEKAISGIAKALHKPEYKISVQANHNLTDNAKKAVTMQHKIVNDIFKAWKEEENKAKHDIKNILDIENMIKE